MSNNASRPEVQRSEIGPIFHDIAHSVYESAEASIDSGELTIKRPTGVHDLGRSMLPLVSHVCAAAYGLMDNAYKEHVEPLLSQSVVVNYDELNGSDFTATTIHGEQLMREAISSGVVVPIRLLEAIAVAEKRIQTHGNEFLWKFSALMNWALAEDPLTADMAEIDAVDASQRVMSPDFLRMLHQLAHAPNAFLGTTSFRLKLKGTFDCFDVARHADELFDLEDGKIIGFSKTFLEDKKSLLLETNDPVCRPGEYSGGCPVRHEQFVKVGDTARTYLEAVHDNDRLPHQGESAITRGARLVGFALQHTA